MSWEFARVAALGRRENGDYEGSLELLVVTREHVVELFGEHSADVLRTDSSLSVTRRRLGDYRFAEALSRTTYDEYRRQYGPTHPETLTCAANLSCDLIALGAEDPALWERAHELAERTYANYRTVLGEQHPFTLAAATNLVIVRRLDGEPLAALDLGTTTLAALEERLGAGHPASVACRADLAGALVQLGRFDEAVPYDEQAHRDFAAVYNDRHPRVLFSEYNLAVDRLQLGEPGAPEELHGIESRLTARFGDKHPTSLAVAARRRIDFDLEMPPI
jgi:hypothetical protein